jgi:AhpD family alkylhydroperoxidase
MDRVNWMQVSLDGATALDGVHHYVTQKTNLPKDLIDLVFLRVPQIYGRAHCIDLHSRDLVKLGMSVDKLLLVPVWHEAI